MIFIKFFFCGFLIFNPLTFISAQSDSNLNDFNSKKLSRLHLMSGYSSFKDIEATNSPFVLFSYHFSSFEQSSKGVAIKFSFEPGIMYLNSDSRGHFFPYLRLSPEIGFDNNFFININASGLYWDYSEGETVVPFLGISGNYLVYLNDDFALEFESGFNSSLFTNRPYTFYYLSIGVAII